VSPARDTVINHGEAPGRQGDRKITLYRKAAETGDPTNSEMTCLLAQNKNQLARA